MYPYESKLQWWIRPRHKHLVDAIERRPDLLQGEQGDKLQRRLERIEFWLKVRVVLLVFLSFSIIASVSSTVLSWLPDTEMAEEALRLFIRVATTFAGLFTASYFFTMRTLGQLEIDALLMLHVHHLGGPRPATRRKK